jgi:hypothetical protein
MPAITHFDLVVADTSTTTSGTEETVGTVTTLSETQDIMAFWAQAASTGVRTAAEGVAPEIIVNPKSVLPEEIRFAAGDSDGGAPATNIAAYVSYGKFLPIMPTTTDLGNRDITFKADLAYEATGDNALQTGVFYATGSYDVDALKNRGIGIDALQSRIRWSDTMSLLDNDGATSKAFPESITIPGWCSEVVAIGLRVEPDAALTAGEVFLAYVELTGTLENMFPQKYPLPSFGAGLGTAVGGGMVVREMILPAYWILPKRNVTIQATYNAIQAQTGDVGVHVTLYCR